MKYFFHIFVLACLLPGFGYGQTLSSPQGMNFGPITFAGNPQNGQITMGTNGAILYGASTSGSGVGTPGQVQITATAGSVVNIRCRNTARVAKVGSTTLNVGPIKVSMGTGQTYAAATQCAGLNTVILTHTISANSSLNTLYVGGRLQTNNATVANGTYSATTSGGQLVTIRVILQ